MIVGVFDKPVKEEDKGGVVGRGGCEEVRVRKVYRKGGLIEGDGRYALLKINIVWTFVKLIGEFDSLLNSTCV